MDDQAFALLLNQMKDVKSDTVRIIEKQEQNDERFADGNLRFLEMDNKIENLEKNKVSSEEFDPIKNSVENRDKKERGMRTWLGRILTSIGLIGLGTWIDSIFG